MSPDLTPDTTSEWLERGLMLAGVALFFTALLIAGPLPSMVGFLDDATDSADFNESAVVDESTPERTETMGTEDRSGDADGESTESGDTDGGDADGDDGDSDGSDDSDESDERDEPDERDEDNEADEDEDSDEADDSDADDDDDKPGKGHGRDNNNGRGNG